mgnify:FL=1
MNSLTLTEKDKKYLILLLWVIVFAVLGYCGIRPLIEKNTKIRNELAVEKAVQEELQSKVMLLTSTENAAEAAYHTLQEQQKVFFEEMESTDVDKLLTSLALMNGLTVNELNITMPEKGSYAVIPAFQDQEVKLTAPSVYEVKAVRKMTGNRKNLQKMIDACAQLDPKIRICEFAWSSVLQDDEAEEMLYSMVMTVSLYMYEDEDVYMMREAGEVTQ